MRKLKILLIGLFVSLFVAGCGNNTDLVKDGIMNFNKTITVGEAFDNWKDCKNREWESFETDNGTPVVQFTCEKKNAKEYLQKVKSFLSKKEQKKASYLDIKSNKQIFQWTINKDDTFQIDNVQVETVWADGKKFSDSQKPMKQLEAVYDNEITFNLREINKMTATQLANTFYWIKERGAK
ncbi:MAG: hypothetical protein QM482_08795 [Sulfurospirillum sp.]